MIAIPKAVAKKHWRDDYAALEQKAATGIDGLRIYNPPRNDKGQIAVDSMFRQLGVEPLAIMRPGDKDDARSYLFYQNW